MYEFCNVSMSCLFSLGAVAVRRMSDEHSGLLISHSSALALDQMGPEALVKKFELTLDAGENPVFKGGEVITGKIHVELAKAATIRAVKLQLKGRAVCLNEKKRADVEKVYFDSDMTILERPPGVPEPGHFNWIENYEYTLPFECPLPRGCPTSYEGPHAYVRYFIKASLVEDCGKEYYVKKAFPLVAPSEGYSVAGEPVSAEHTVAYGKCCCKGKVKADLSLPKSCYLPGEKVVGHLKIGDKHPKNVLENMEVRLVDRVVRVADPTQNDASPWRTLMYHKLDSTGSAAPRSKKAPLELHALHLITVPAVVPTTRGDFSATSELRSASPMGTPTKHMLESPSSATLRMRRTPFIRVEYAIQLTLGPSLLLEVPIEVGELSSRSPDAHLTPFVAGPQAVEEPEDDGKIALNGPFVYTPVYYAHAGELATVYPVAPETVLELGVGNGKAKEKNGKDKKKDKKKAAGDAAEEALPLLEAAGEEPAVGVERTTTSTQVVVGPDGVATATTTVTTVRDGEETVTTTTEAMPVGQALDKVEQLKQNAHVVEERVTHTVSKRSVDPSEEQPQQGEDGVVESQQMPEQYASGDSHHTVKKDLSHQPEGEDEGCMGDAPHRSVKKDLSSEPCPIPKEKEEEEEPKVAAFHDLPPSSHEATPAKEEEKEQEKEEEQAGEAPEKVQGEESAETVEISQETIHNPDGSVTVRTTKVTTGPTGSRTEVSEETTGAVQHVTDPTGTLLEEGADLGERTDRQEETKEDEDGTVVVTVVERFEKPGQGTVNVKTTVTTTRPDGSTSTQTAVESHTRSETREEYVEEDE